MLYTHIKDSLYNSEMNQGLNEYNARYRNEQITSERDHHLNSKRRILWCCIAAIALLAFAIWFLARRNKSIKFILDDTMAKLDAARKHTASRPSQTPERDVVEPLKAEIRKQIMEGKEVDLQEAAAVLCTTRSNLNRQIKTQTGGSSSALVTEVRIEMAKEILSGQKDKPVSEVAMLCGINDVSYFITLFKKSQARLRSNGGTATSDNSGISTLILSKYGKRDTFCLFGHISFGAYRLTLRHLCKLKK